MIAIVKTSANTEIQSTATLKSTGIAKWLREFVLALQLARMTSVLNGMPDWVLAEIGITRSETPDYARKLISKDE